MNYLDIGILIVLAAFLIKGVWRGLLREVCALAGLLLGALFAFRFHLPLADVLMSIFGISSQVAVVVAFVLLFVSTVLFFAVLGYLLSRFVQLLFLGGLNRVAGGFFGLAEGALLVAVVLFTFSLADLPEGVERTLFESQLARPFVDLGETAFQESRRFFAEWR